MNADVFLDTNVLVYAASRLPQDTAKARIANSIIQSERIGLSAQILQEFLVVTTRKVRSPWSLDDALDWIEALEDLPCISIDADLVRFGAELSVRHQVSYWDGAVLAAAHRLNVKIVYSEDLNHGQSYGEVRVVNPFRLN
jgi:predicted nucleic acid-binding protein